jgi:hypothetical protein
MYTRVGGTGLVIWNDKSGDKDREEMRITLRWYLAAYVKPLTIAMFLYNGCL